MSYGEEMRNAQAHNFNEQLEDTMARNWQNAVALWRAGHIDSLHRFMSLQTDFWPEQFKHAPSEILLDRAKERVVTVFMEAADERALSKENILLIGAALCRALDDMKLGVKQ